MIGFSSQIHPASPVNFTNRFSHRTACQEFEPQLNFNKNPTKLLQNIKEEKDQKQDFENKSQGRGVSFQQDVSPKITVTLEQITAQEIEQRQAENQMNKENQSQQQITQSYQETVSRIHKKHEGLQSQLINELQSK